MFLGSATGLCHHPRRVASLLDIRERSAQGPLLAGPAGLLHNKHGHIVTPVRRAERVAHLFEQGNGQQLAKAGAAPGELRE